MKNHMEMFEVDEAATAGMTVTVDPDVAESMSAFEENALDYDEAQLSLLDIDPVTDEVKEGAENE